MRRLLLASILAAVSIATAAEPPLRGTGGEWPPVIGAWFWNDRTLEPEGYKPFLDAAAGHAPYTLLTTSLRVSKGEVTEAGIHDQVAKAVRYAQSLGLKVAFDLDVRLARRAFQARWPEELQEELVLKIVDLPPEGSAQVSFEGRDLADHMTGNTIPYRCVATRLVRVYAMSREKDGVDPDTVRDVTDQGIRTVAEGTRKLTVSVPSTLGRTVCVIAAHTYLTPDVFAPHLIEFQRQIIRQYADAPLAGLMKDEWGFPPDHSGNPQHDRYWYSQAMARAYAGQSGGRDLVRDALLMSIPHQDRDHERQAAINRYLMLCRQRNAEIEEDYYRACKETFGPAAFVGTHATWTPYPGIQEFRKHGLDWWQARRDVGQSDETTPYPCRTSLAKRWGFPLWYNQFYSPQADDYVRELWSGALGGGRLNVHPLYPRSDTSLGDDHLALMRHGLMTAMSRLRMLDFITRSPLDCPAAVVFGHACAMNWAGPSYNRVGLEIASGLCAEGYPADLIPSSLIGASALHVDEQGYVCLGPQRYRAVVLYQPQFGDGKELEFWQRACRGKSEIFIIGDWTLDAEARPLDAAPLDQRVRRCREEQACVQAVARYLDDSGVVRVTGWSKQSRNAAPPRKGFCALADGTCVRVSGSKDPAGDPIRETFTWRGHAVAVDAIGVVAIRFGPDGKVAALAAGGLKSLKTDGLELTLPERADVALVRQADGTMRGVLQGLAGAIPETLLRVTGDWQRLATPALLPDAK